jgi:hypothetical protein
MLHFFFQNQWIKHFAPSVHGVTRANCKTVATSISLANEVLRANSPTPRGSLAR